MKFVREGTCLSLSSIHELNAAEAVKEMFPFVDAVKFLKTGSEACSAAIRIARTATGRDLVLSEGYHGWHDDFVSLTAPAYGIPGRGESMQRLGSHPIDRTVAAVIVEPIMLDDGPERLEELRNLRTACDASGTLLIFDEIITGFRYQKHGASNVYGILPDILCLGKAMGGGLPLSAVCAKAHLMHDDRYFVSSTFGGEILSLVASLAFIRALQTRVSIDDIWTQGEQMRQRINQLVAPLDLRIAGYATRGVWQGGELTRALFFQECCKAGILFGSTWFFCHRHPEHTTQIYAAINDVVERIKLGAVQIEGELPSSPFAQRVRGQ